LIELRKASLYIGQFRSRPPIGMRQMIDQKNETQQHSELTAQSRRQANIPQVAAECV
jgi:hypothetical protein